MNDLKQRVRALSTELPSRDVGSRGEEIASETLADELYNLGLQTDIDGFTCPGNLRVSRSIYFLVGFLAALICLFVPGIRLIALILGIAALVLLYLSYVKVDPLGSVLTKYESQNVVARYVPQGLADSPRRAKVVITAYYDVQKPSLFQMPAIRSFYPIVRKVVIGAVIAIPVCSLLAMFPFPGVVQTIFAVIALIAGIVNLIAIIDQLLGTFLKTPKGANNNAAGLAVMCSLAEKVVTADVQAPFFEGDYAYEEYEAEPADQEIPESDELPAEDVVERAPRARAASDDPFARAAEIAARTQSERDQVVEEVWGGVSASADTAAIALPEEAAPAQPAPVQAEEPQAVEPEPVEEAPVEEAPAPQPAKPIEPSPEVIAASRGSVQSRFAYPAPAPRKKSSSKAPSWWQKVEEEKLNGEIGRASADGVALRSRYADAPANNEPLAPEPPVQQAVEPVAPVVEPIIEAETVQPVEQPVIEPAADAAEPVVEAQPAADEMPVAPAPVDRSIPADVLVPVVTEADEASEKAGVAGEIPEGPVDVSVDPDSTVSFTPLPVEEELAEEAVESSEEPRSYEEPLLVPEGGADWPSGSYKFSRNRYEGGVPEEQAEAGEEYQPDISDYLRSNYMLDGEAPEIPQVASNDDTLVQEGEGWLGAADTALIDAVPAEEEPVEEFKPAHRSEYQPPAIDRSAEVPASLLNLPVIGGLGGDLSAEKNSTQSGFGSDVASDDFIHDEAEEKNLTGSFAPVSASGVLEPVTAEMLEQYNEDGGDIHIDDAVDYAYEEQQGEDGSFAAAREVEMPKKGRFSLFGGRKGKRRDDMGSASSWLGVKDDYNPRDEGASIGSWDNFDDDDDGWDGGAYGGSSREQNRDAIDALSDDLLNKEVWFVALGASGAGSFGMRNLLRAHSGEMRNSRIINLEAIGTGELCFTSSEPIMLLSKRTDPRLQKLISKAGKSARVKVDPLDLSWRSTEATTALGNGVRAISIIGVEGNTTPGWRWKDDVDDIVDERNLQDVYKLLIEIIKGC